jgi:alanine racemase
MEAVGLAKQVMSSAHLRLAGVYTHFAVADDPSHEANAVQLARFESVLTELRSEGIDPGVVHASNSAATLNNDHARFGAVRVGIAMYGLLPDGSMKASCAHLTPALSLRARVSAVRWISADEAVSYGLRKPVNSATLIATIPLGYADGVPRGLWTATTGVLIHGKRRMFAGTITMDQIMVDCGDDASVSIGDEVVLIGSQGDDTISVSEWAEAMDTIDYEIVCGISSRIDRRYR